MGRFRDRPIGGSSRSFLTHSSDFDRVVEGGEAFVPELLQPLKEVVANALPLLKAAVVCQNVKRVDYFFSRHD
jgi:hypothetical protein